MAKFISNAVMHTLNFGSFFGKCFFSCGHTFDEICKELKKQKQVDWLAAFKNSKYLFDQNNCGYVYKTQVEVNGEMLTYFFLIMKKRFDFSDYYHSILAHEVIHLVTFNLKDHLDIVQENEAFAYTHTHIMNQCYEILRRK